MPIPVPPGGLPAAHRVICMRAVRALARRNEIEFGFASATSKKCVYCTLGNEKCRPVPLYVGREFEELRVALDLKSAAENGGEEEDLVGMTTLVVVAARELATVVQVATAQVKDQSAVDLLVAAHYQQQVAQEQIRVLTDQVAALTDVVSQLVGLASASGPSSSRRGGRGDRGGRGGRGDRGGRGGRGRTGGRTGGAPLSAPEGLGGSGLAEDSESELTEPPEDMDLA